MCRLEYWGVPKKLPKTVVRTPNCVIEYFNSELGQGNPKEYIERYENVIKM